MLRSALRARRLLVGLILALPPLLWVVYAAERASLTTLGRDQGIFQYVAWAVSQGLVDYRDIRDVNGPLIHLIHLAFLKLGGADEHRFRVLDLTVTVGAFFLAGAALPGLTASASADFPSSKFPRRKPGPGARFAPRKPATLAVRLVWGLAAAVVLSAQYLTYLYWDLAQRESFCDWFVLGALALQLLGQTPRAFGERTRIALIAAAGALSLAAWLGKPSYAPFTFVQLGALALDGAGGLTLRRRLLAFVGGAAAGSGLLLLYFVRWADLGAFLRAYLVDVPGFYRFVWPKPAEELLTISGAVTPFVVGAVSSALLVGVVLSGLWPMRALPIALFPVMGIVNVLLQRKGFPYHFHPVTLGTALQLVAVVAWVDERTALLPSRRAARLVPLGLAAALALRTGTSLDGSPHLSSFWVLEKAATPERRESRDYLVYFHDRDYFPADLRDAARFLAERTAPSDRVQIYGMDPYLLFLARRLGASPYIYAYDLNADVALSGEPPMGPTPEQKAHIQRLRDAHEDDLLAHWQRTPPAAIVYFDKAPLLSSEDAVADFEAHCPKAAAWARDRYREVTRFGNIRVSLRGDLAAEASSDARAGAP